MDPLIPYHCEAIHLFLSRLRTDISRAEPMNLCMFSHEPLGPGGEDISWPDQVAFRGRKASSTRKIKPQTSLLMNS